MWMTLEKMTCGESQQQNTTQFTSMKQPGGRFIGSGGRLTVTWVGAVGGE